MWGHTAATSHENDYRNTNNNNYRNNNNYNREGFNGSSNFSTNSNTRNNKDSFNDMNLAPVDWSSEALTTVQKVFYKESQVGCSAQEIQSYYAQNSISTKAPGGESMPKPILKWSDAQFPDCITSEVKKANFTCPSPIQALAFPVVMSGHDFIGIAQTGSGKTLSFLLPAIVHINAQTKVKRGEGPVGLVLAPTRELAVQIEKEAAKFSNSSGLKCACIYGGADKQPQRMMLQSGVDIVIATPGRLIDFLENSATNLKRVSFLVLDEADRMLDMGFEIQIRKILGQVRPDRQTVMFSATWPKNVQNLASDFIKNQPVYVQIGQHELAVNERIKQVVYVTEYRQKTNICIDQLDQLTQRDKVLIFAATKKGCENLCQNLIGEGFKALAIHGDKSQKERDSVMEKFKSGEVKILVATDVASRGLDVKDVTHVINFDFPKVLEDYVHRIGRTARAGAYGVAVSMLTENDDRKIAREYVEMLRDSSQEIPAQLLDLANIHPRERIQFKQAGNAYYEIKLGRKPEQQQQQKQVQTQQQQQQEQQNDPRRRGSQGQKNNIHTSSSSSNKEQCRERERERSPMKNSDSHNNRYNQMGQWNQKSNSRESQSNSSSWSTY